MKRKNRILLMPVLTIFMFAAVPAMGQNKNVSDSTKQDTIIYTCSMHPEIQSSKPGKCPKCGMELIQKKSSSSEHKMDMMMCPMHGMVDMNHQHDEQKKDKKKMMKGMGIAMGVMMVAMMTVMILLVAGH
ncbi:MAG: hypothetical protein HY841_01920 [Bacteroidetes bacterium]|nr:hypothetical protein [Bacteroidota bacterium]